MRILLVTTMLPPYCGGGVSSHVRDLAESLAARGEDVTVFSCRRGHPVRPDEGRFIPRGTRVLWARSIPDMFLRIGAIVRRGRFDIIHVHSFSALALAPLVLGGPAAIVFTLHSDTANYMASVHGWTKRSHPAYVALRWFERFAVRFPDATIAVSNRMKDYADSIGLPGTIPIANAVDARYWAPAVPAKPDLRGAILVPRMHVPKNGIEYAIEAMGHVLKQLPDAHLLLTGDGPLRAALERQARATAPGHIHFLGMVSRERMRELYSRVKLVTIPSITSAGTQENTSIAALEAMASGKPVVATETGGLIEIVRNGQDGFLIPERNAQALAAAAVQLLRNPESATHLGREARDRVMREFSVESWVSKVLDAYEQAQDSRARRSRGAR